MSVTLKLELTDEQALGLIRLAAKRHWSVEDQVLHMIDVELFEPDIGSAVSLDEFLRDLPTGKPG